MSTFLELWGIFHIEKKNFIPHFKTHPRKLATCVVAQFRVRLYNVTGDCSVTWFWIKCFTFCWIIIVGRDVIAHYNCRAYIFHPRVKWSAKEHNIMFPDRGWTRTLKSLGLPPRKCDKKTEVDFTHGHFLTLRRLCATKSRHKRYNLSFNRSNLTRVRRLFSQHRDPFLAARPLFWSATLSLQTLGASHVPNWQVIDTSLWKIL